MHTIKLVVIGASGVGKTSLRGQYISGRFSKDYRATIGADFIAKTLPHPTKPEQTVTLQIWDTAGQERFSSLSAAFFRGADAVILMYDVHQIQTLEALKKWWGEFCERAPLAEEDMQEYPCFVVGNKIDLTSSVQDDTLIPKHQVQQFLNELIPPDPSSPPAMVPPVDATVSPTNSPTLEIPRTSSINISPRVSPIDDDLSPNPSSPKAHHNRAEHNQSRPRSTRSTNKFNTISSVNTTISIYHTPSSSLFSDAVFHTARSSPESSHKDAHPSPFPMTTTTTTTTTTTSPTSIPAPRQRRLTNLSSDSTSSGSVATITPSLFARSRPLTDTEGSTTTTNSSSGTALTTPEDDNNIRDLPPESITTEDPPQLPQAAATHANPSLVDYSSNPMYSHNHNLNPNVNHNHNHKSHSRSLSLLPPPPPPERGPSLTFTSAKTGEGVKELFERIAARVMQKLEYEESLEVRRMYFREASGTETIRLSGRRMGSMSAGTGAGAGAGSGAAGMSASGTAAGAQSSSFPKVGSCCGT